MNFAIFVKKMVSNKKAVFFTLISIVIIATLFIWFNTKVTYTDVDTIPITRGRVTRINDLVENLNKNYFERIARVATYTSLSAIASYETQSKNFLDKSSFECALYTVPMHGQMLNLSWIADSGDLYFDTDTGIASNLGSIAVTYGSFGGNYVFAQSFKPTITGNISNITVNLKWSTTSPQGQVILEVRDNQCGVPGPVLVGNATLNIIADTSWHIVGFNFSNPLYLTGGKSYYFVFKSKDSGNNTVYVSKSSMSYVDGSPITKDSYEYVWYLDSKLSTPIIGQNYILAKFDIFNNLSNNIYFANLTIIVTNFTIYQNAETGPWDVGYFITVNYTLNSSIATWQSNTTESGKVSVLLLPDPYYNVKMNGTFTGIIKNMIGNISTDYITNNHQWTLNYLKLHMSSETYKFEEDAPSYLMRFYADTSSSSCCGIERVLPNMGKDTNMTYIDYCFWSGRCDGSNINKNVSLYNVTTITTPSFKFLLEPYHGQRYNITEHMTYYTNISTGHG